MAVKQRQPSWSGMLARSPGVRAAPAGLLARRAWSWLDDPAALLVLGWAVVWLGLALRLWHVGARSLWFDEIVTLCVPGQPWGDLLRAAAAPGTNAPPLFAILFKIWMLAGTSDGWLYLGTALIGAALVACTWLLGRRLFGAPVAAVASALCALSTYQVTYSQYVRMYDLLALTGIASVYLLWRAAGTNRRWWWLAWSGSVAACLYSFYYAGFLLIGEFLWLWRAARRRPELARRARLSAGIGVALYLPWIPAMLHQMTDGGSRAWMARPTIGTVRYTIDQFFFTGSTSSVAAVGFYAVLGLIALGAALPGDEEGRLLLGLVAACGILLPFAASLVLQPFYDPRYLVYGAVALSLFAARGLVWLVTCWVRQRGQRVFALAAFGLAFLVALMSAGPLRAYYAHPVSYRPDVRDATALLLRQYRPGDMVAYDAVFAYLPAIWYAHQMAGPGAYQSSAPYSWVPAAWVQRAPMRQVLLGREFMRLARWPAPGRGRVWMVSIVGPPRRGSPPRNPAWFAPPAGAWKLVRSESGFYGLLVQLYVRR